MSYILSIYSKVAFKEYILPSINNADYDITIQRKIFSLKEDVCLHLEVLSNQWFVKESDEYQVGNEVVRKQRMLIEKNMVMQFVTKWHEQCTIIIKKMDSMFHAYRKYRLDNVRSITIGKDPGCDICYDFLGMVSRNHARIIRGNQGFRIENSSSNGIYVNSNRVNDGVYLEFGSFINIMGLHMVFLGNMIAIEWSENVRIQSRDLVEAVNEMGEDPRCHVLTKRETMYHRAPRNYERVENGEIEIEEPPQLPKTKEESVFQTIAPSLTMALPMLFGCFLMLYSYKSMGMSSSPMMYSGLIMSVLSAGISVMWALINLKKRKKEEKEAEEHRFNAYSNYLVEKSEEIKQRYEETERKMKITYPDALTCLSYDEKNGLLWNRNYSHDDFLTHRIGSGEIPFQVKIDIPKKKFRLYNDELSQKPAFIKNNFMTLYDVPITVDLLKNRLIGVLGGRNNKKGAIDIARILTAQIVANNCYTDVKVGFIYDNSSSSDSGNWRFAKWLPHAWSEDHNTRFVASSKEEASEVFYELARVLRARLSGEEHVRKKTKIPKPYYVVFISDVSMLEGELFSKYVFDENEEIGLTTVLLAENPEELPNECEFIIENSADFSGMYRINDGWDRRQKIQFDNITGEALEGFARYTASLRVMEMEEGGEIPNAITFFEMLNINRIEQYPVAENWAKCKSYENIRGILGKKAGGHDCYLDVHEKYHGPHGLVAGTTGSGKSETLQTYILSLAVDYSPDDIGFFIIDYKGGGMANLFDGLPHMIGQISNLSGNQVKRAMISIKSENRRRQRVFSENGVNNINAYTKLYKSGEALLPVPHLFIIIDEFAELKREEPDFMKELISVAQVGRSLGVHLILATQKPSGTVDDNIWSNSKFRLCLRVQDQADSKDMLHKPDAAYITQPGRGYLQVGSDEVYELFQSGFSGAIFDDSMTVENNDIAKLITLPGKVGLTGNSVKLSQKKRSDMAWIDCLCECMLGAGVSLGKSVSLEEDDVQKYVNGMYMELEKREIEYPVSDYNTARLLDFIYCYNEARELGKEGDGLSETILLISSQKGKKLPQAKEKTQLDVTKEYLAKVARENHYDHQITLWMPVLGEKIYLDEFQEFSQNVYQDGVWPEPGKEWGLQIVIGKMDDPENQNQMPLLLDFAEDDNVVICGAIVSGKSTTMQTMIYGLIHKYTPDYINIYCIDFSSKMLGAFEHAPHVGGVMFEGDEEKIKKFFNMMENIVTERKKIFRGGNYKQYVRAKGVTIPAILLFIDNYGAFKARTEEMHEDMLIQLSKEGVSLGIYLIVSGNGFGMNEITNRVAENLKTVLCLEQKDKFAYAEFLHTTRVEVIPENGVKGRGLAYYGTRILEFQTALVFEAENNYICMEKIAEISKDMKANWKGRCAKKIPEIPEKPIWTDFIALEEYQSMLESRDYVPVGYNEANAQVYGIPLAQIYCYLICGAKRTGKTNFLKAFIYSALNKKNDVCIIDMSGELKKFENFDVSYLSDEEAIFTYFRDTLTPVFQERNAVKKNLLKEDKEENEIYQEQSKENSLFLFISDFGKFIELAYDSDKNISSFIENIFEKGRLHNIFFVAELDGAGYGSMRGYSAFETFVGYKTGIHFGGRVADNSFLEYDSLSYSQQTAPEKMGVGMLPDVFGDGIRKVVIPLAK